MDMVLSSTTVTAGRLEKLAQLYRQVEASDLMTRTLDKLFQHEAAESQMQLNQLQEDLVAFENQYALSSQEFYRQYQNGETDDGMDFVEWASLFQMSTNLQKRLQLLTDSVS